MRFFALTCFLTFLKSKTLSALHLCMTYDLQWHIAQQNALKSARQFAHL